MPDTAVEPHPPQTRRRGHSLRRWIMRALVAFITLAIVFFVTVHLILGSKIPRQIVIAQVQNTLGLRITAATLSTGWFGHSTLRDVTLSLPLAEHAFLEVPELRVDHTVLPILLLTQSIDIKSMELDRPTIHVTQDKYGRWNLQDVADLLARAGGTGQASQDAQKHSPLVLPKINLRDGEIDVTDNTGRHASLAPLNVVGTPVNALVWQYDASLESTAGSHIKLTGRVAPNDNFTHDVEFALSGLAPVAQPWITNFDPNASIAGRWHGARTADGIAGRLQLESLHYQSLSAEQADIAVQSSLSGVTVTPTRLIVHTGIGAMQSLAVNGGSITLDDAKVTSNQLELSALEGRMRIDSDFTFADQSGSLHARWQALQPGTGVTTSGSLDASLRRNWPDLRAVNVDLNTTGAAAGSTYAASLNLTGSGKSWDAADWVVMAPNIAWNGKQPLSLSNLSAHLSTRPGEVTLDDLSLRGSSDLIGQGKLHVDPAHPEHYDWWLYLQGQNWSIPRGRGATVAFGINSWGDQNEIRLARAYGIAGQLIAAAEGYYYLRRPKPVDLNINISELPKIASASADDSTSDPNTAGATVARQHQLQGQMRGEAELLGTLFPLALVAQGQLHGEQLVIEGRPLQNVDLKCTGALKENYAELNTEELEVLGGEWTLHASFPSHAPGHDDSPEVVVRVHDLPLANVGDLLHAQDIAGVARGWLEVDIDRPSLDQIAASGHFQADNVRARQFKADSVSTDVSLHDGVLDLSPVQFRLADRQADAKLSTNLHNPQRITASLTTKAWPLDAGSVHGQISVDAKQFVIDAENQTANGGVTFGVITTLPGQPLLRADGSALLAGRVLNLQTLNASGLDGTASGSATIDIDRPLASIGAFKCDGLNLGALASYGKMYEDLGGSISGRAMLGPADDPRSLGPLKLSIELTGRDAHFRTVPFTDAHLPIYFDTGRAVLDAGKIHVADGRIDLFARMTRHVEDTISTQIHAELHGLDLDRLLHVFDSKEADKKKSYPGRLDGTISLVGDPRYKQDFFGQAFLNVHDSDLGNFGPFAKLYDVMHLGANADKPIGSGTIALRYDNDTIVISSLRYYNRGTDAYGLITASDISKYPESGLDGTLVGTFRPLKDIKLPFFADADKIFSTLQGSLTSIVIGGKMVSPTYVPQAASELNNTMRSFLLGSVSKEK